MSTVSIDANGGEPSVVAGERPSKRPFIIAGGVVVAGALALGTYTMRTRGYETTDDAQVESDVVAVAVRLPGLVTAVSVQDNHRVKRGDLLARIDDRDCTARVEQARAELVQAQAQATQAEAQEQIVAAEAKGGIAAARAFVAGSSYAVRGAHADIASARAEIDAAEADAKSAGLDFDRYQALRAKDVVPQSDLDAARTAADRANAALTRARAAYESAEQQRRAADARVSEAQGRLTQSAPLETQLTVARASTALQRARVKAAEAALTLAQSQLDATYVVAPIDGLLTNLTLRPGVLATVGTPVALVVPPDSYVIANFKETQIGGIHPGQPARVSVDAFAQRSFQGEIETIAGGSQGRFSLLPADNAAGNFVKVVQRVPVRIRLLDAKSDPSLLPGLSAEVSVDVR